MNIALETAVIAAAVSLSVSLISPAFSHHLWKRQKRKEQQLALAERYSALRAQMAASFDVRDFKAALKTSPAETEMIGILFLIPVLFDKKEGVKLATDLLNLRGSEGANVSMMRFELQAYLFAEALDIPYKKVPKLS